MRGWLAGWLSWLAGAGAWAATAPELLPEAADAPLAIRAVTLAGEPSQPCLTVREVCIDLSASYANPYDPAQIDVAAIVTAPDGATRRVPGFYYQPLRRTDDAGEAGTPMLQPDGQADWRVRFCPDRPGQWRFRVTATDRSGTVESATETVSATPSDAPGYIGRDPAHPRYFRYQNGTPFIPVGQNLQNDWPVYRHSKLLADAGGNAVRAWTFCHWTWLEWTFRPNVSWARPGHFLNSYGGAGVYNQRIAWIADHHLDAWQRDGLRVMLCLGNGSELTGAEDQGAWGGHPYNVANGGWLTRGEDFWTDPRARQAYRNRLRYLVARWGASPTIWAWEFWNEIGRENEAIVDWHREMAAYLHELDPHHLVTTSHWGTNAEASPRLWGLDGLDVMQTHNYAGPAVMATRNATMLTLAEKPLITGEGGGPGGKDEDPTGIDIHNCLWSAPMTGAAGTTLPWWWRERIEPRDLFFHYRPVREFLTTLLDRPGARRVIQPDEVVVETPEAKGLRPVMFSPLGGGWGIKAPREQFEVLATGEVPHVDEMGAVLYGQGRQAWRSPPRITVDFPVGGQGIVQIREAAHGVLTVELDGREIVRDSRFDTDRQSFGTDIAIDIPAGRHVVRLDNAGRDWIRVAHVLLTEYRDAAVTPDLAVYGLRVGETYGLWLHHRLDEWNYAALGFKPVPVEGAKLRLAVPDGTYQVTWYDTRTGTERHSRVVAVDGLLRLALPRVEQDVAIRIEPARQ